MLTDDVLKWAKLELSNNPSCRELLDTIWPFVKYFDFSNKAQLKIPMPTHVIPYLENRVNGQVTVLFNQKVAYSHRTIRKTLTALGLSPHSLHDKEYLIIKAKSHSS